MAALFNYAVRYYDLNDNPCRKAGSIGKSKADDMEFWTKQEFKQFLSSMDKKPEAGMGSIDFFAVARSVLLVGRIEGEPNTRAVVQIKNNLHCNLIFRH